MQGHGDEAGSKVKGPLRKDARSHRRYFSQVGQGSAPGGTCHNVTALSLRCFGKNVTDAKLEKTSLSADVFLGVPFVTGPYLRYFSWPFFGHMVASHLASGGPDPSKGTFAGRRSFM